MDTNISGGQKKALDQPRAKITDCCKPLTLMLRHKLWYSIRAGNDLNHRVISPVPKSSYEYVKRMQINEI